jgi:peptide/nickel transport system permease protein
MLQGDWGFSFVSRIDVDTLICSACPATLLVIGASQLLALLIALPVGVLAATRPYSLFDQIANTWPSSASRCRPSSPASCSSWCSPSARLAAVRLPRRHRATGWRWWWEHFKQSIMPVTVLGLFQGASWMRYVRSAVLDVIRLDYVTTARSKGLAERW